MIIIIFDFSLVLVGFRVVGTLWGMHGMGRGTGKRTEVEEEGKKNRRIFFPAMDGNQQQELLLLFNEARARLLGDTTTAVADNPTANSATQINPSILVIIIILTIIFFLSCCLHILIRYSVRGPRRDPSALVTLTAMQGQLQQLFHLHDSGVEQAFIDTLPVFFYKSVTGLKEGADCAVCLCEFEPDDRLRLLPKCSHAFHIDCIDTWLLSHSTCPLCRRSLLPDGWNLPPLSQEPLFLESNRHDTGATLPDDVAETGRQNASHPVIIPPDALKIPETGRLLPVQLGKFKASQNLDSNDAPTGEDTSASSIARRAYSFGSYEYIVDSSNSTHVFIAPTPSRRRTSTPRPTTPGHRTTLSDSTPDHEHAYSSSSNSHYYNYYNTPILTPHHPFLNNLFPPCRPTAVEASTSTSKQSLGNPNSNFSIDIEEEQQQQQHAAAPPRLSLCADVGIIRNQVAGSFRKSVQRNSFRLATATLQQDATPAARRAVSFRLPPISDAQLKASASRRSHSETELPELIKGAHHNNPSDQATTIHQASTINSSAIGANILSGSSSGSARVSSFARKTINWLVGRQKRVIHASTSSTQMDPK